MYETSLKIKENHYGKNHVEATMEIANLGNVYRQLGDLEKAKEMYEVSIEILESHYGKNHIETVIPIGNLGTVYS